MNEDKVVPNIRFMGFKDKWKAVKINYIVNIKAGGDLEKNKLLKDGKYPVIGNTLKNNGIIGYTNTFKIDAPAVTVTGRGEIGKAFYQPIPFTPVVRLLALVPKNENIDMKFLSNEIENLNFFSESTGVPQLTAPELGTYKVGLTEYNEQQKIGELFTKLDKLLDLQQQKIDKLELLKKALLQKLFPKHDADIPELRFKGVNDEWKSYLLGKIAVFINGRAFKQNELLDKGKYPVLRVGNFYTNDKWFYSDLELPEKLYANKGDLLYTWSATFGPHIWKGDKVIYHYHIWKIIFSSEVSKQFALQMLLNDKEELMNNTNGSTMIHLTKNEMEKKVVKIPIKPEQQKIGNLLSKVDQLIELENKKLQNFQQVKKCLLQNMFVD